MSEVSRHQPGPKAVIQFSDAAKAHLISGLSKKPRAMGVRFSVKTAGCSGLSYVIEYVDNQGENDITFALSDQYQVFVDKNSLNYLQDLRVDYIKEGLGSKLVFFNPNQKGQCGCGESFIV